MAGARSACDSGDGDALSLSSILSILNDLGVDPEDLEGVDQADNENNPCIQNSRICQRTILVEDLELSRAAARQYCINNFGVSLRRFAGEDSFVCNRPNDNNRECVNTGGGSFQCRCQAGFQFNSANLQCTGTSII